MKFWQTLLMAGAASARFVMYYDEYHKSRPSDAEAAARAGVDHVVLAFSPSNSTAKYTPFVSVADIKKDFGSQTKVMIAIGGWGDTWWYEQIKDQGTINQFALDISTMLNSTGADGVDIDWEYPGGNGEDYKSSTNDAKANEIAAFPKVLAAIRGTIGTQKLLSIAVPGLQRDMLAYNKQTGTDIFGPVDYVNIMAYDLMNRRDNVTAHQTSVQGALQAVQNYIAIGAPPSKINLGFAFYAKWFETQGDCGSNWLGCQTALLEDATTGADTHASGAMTFEKQNMVPQPDPNSLTVSPNGTCGSGTGLKCPSGCCSQYGNCGTGDDFCKSGCQHAFGTGCQDPDVAASWAVAQTKAITDTAQGGQYYWDKDQKLFWSFDTPQLMQQKFDTIVKPLGIGGVMAWSLGEDSFDWSHIKAIAGAVTHTTRPARRFHA